MKRYLIAAGVALALAVLAAPSTLAIHYSEWSSPVNLGPVVNSASGDDLPAISKDGLSLYFQSNRPGGFGLLDLYVAQRDTKEAPWNAPVNLGAAINTAAQEFGPALSRDGHYLFFYSPRATGLPDIFVSYRQDVHDDLAWDTPVMLGPEVNTSLFSDSNPSFFENDDIGLPQLFFQSDRPGGMGFNDIYMVQADGQGGLLPATLVTELSSAQNDATPEIFRNGLEMFLMSTRPGGSGLNDLWTSTRSTLFSPWTVPQNLGAIVNSASQDEGPALSSDGETLFFGSNRPGFGSFDIYMTTRVREKR
jgi:Tol biopolymer transport system component